MTGAKTAVFIYWLLGFGVSVFADVWKVEVESEVKALEGSCVVLPCSFKYPGVVQPSSRKSGIWHKEKDWNYFIFHEDRTQIADNFKERTKLAGRLGDLNCSLEIDGVKNHDNGPFCFRVELQTSVTDKYSFVKNCVRLNMIVDAPPPVLHSDDSVHEGQPAVFKCSVRHTCPSHQPTLTWSHKGKELVTYKDIGHGNWEVESILSFTPTSADDHTNIICTVQYHGLRKGYETSRPVFVKEQATYNHILIPSICALGAALLVGVVCFLLVKRYKKRIEDLQSRNDNSMFSRLSRMSRRFRSGGNNSESDGRHQRRSIWGRFSRRGHGDQTDSNLDKRSNKTGNKPRMPSPKSQAKSSSGHDYDDDYTNTADLNIYGNA
ncbi:sialic acid-binding Ig-like lectin 14 [Triplophysa dalaica]|uniref:sialic acid-binding Ig-like lectin 14 n=1 Tax=Triplophysa dalaica TaxID=1582913 RepID=UPI0024E0062D|nr:sialic acid-binding Ig-like lectin 14 [Triplophysa dalaica]